MGAPVCHHCKGDLELCGVCWYRDQGMPPLTERQGLLVRIILRYVREHGYPPTLREICQLMGTRSTNGISDHLKALERKGYLRKKKGSGVKARAIALVDPKEG